MSETVISIIDSQQNLVPVSARKARYKKRTPLEIRLIIVVAILAVLLLVFLIVVIVQATKDRKNGKGKPSCNSQKCIESAFTFLESMNRSVDPCEDFYEFACGNFPKNHPVKEGYSMNDWSVEITDKLLRSYKDYLEEEPLETEPNLVRQAKIFFKACEDEENLEKLGLQPMLDVLGRVSLPTQIPDSQTSAGWDIATTLARIQRTLKIMSLVVKLNEEEEDGNEYLKLSTPIPAVATAEDIMTSYDGFPTEKKLVSASQKRQYKEVYMAGLLQLIDARGKAENDPRKLNKASVDAIVADILDFSDKLSEEITKHIEYDGNSTRVSIVDLQIQQDTWIQGSQFGSKIDWKTYVNVLLEHLESPIFKDTDNIYVDDLKYMEDIAKLIADTNIETIQRFLWWQVVQDLASESVKAVRQTKTEALERVMSATVEPTPRWLDCVANVRKLLQKGLVALVAAHDVEKTTIINKVAEMMEEIKTSFRMIVEKSDWLDSKTKKAALEKVDALVSYIGYQDYILNPSHLDDTLKGLTLEGDQHLANVVRVKSSSMEHLLTVDERYMIPWRNKR
ncbi:endothelin-converting enzyme 2-like [Periplaneta americana]|uniref:endothelin-converting enzyme 2-like n=1 Tax=Periplaneta americana TaxID=6978 RepID=UPI0037E72761